MNASSAEHAVPTIADAEILRRVQQRNQQQIIGKLLHDLRNPVHSMRITVELFARLTQKDADTAALLGRAARYVAPAESAIAVLIRQSERLSTYLSPPQPPALQPIAINDWVAEICMLLRESIPGVDASVASTLGDEVCLTADRPRLSHALLRWCLSKAEGALVLNARATESNRIQIQATSSRWTTDRFEPPFTVQELELLIGCAGGLLMREGGDAAAFSFPRAP